MAPPPPATCGPQPSGHPWATDNSRSFLRADSRGSSLSGTHSSQAAAARSTLRLGVLGPPLSSVLGSGPQHWVCWARPGDPRPRSAATALALGSGRRGPSASILSPIPPHSAPSSPGDKGASARRRPSATRCLYSRQGCEGAEGRGHMTGTPAPPLRGLLRFCSSPRTSLRQFPLLSLQSRHFLRAWGEGGQVRRAGRGSAGPFPVWDPGRPRGAPPGSCGCRFPAPRGCTVAAGSTSRGCERALSGSAPFPRLEPDLEGPRAAGPWPFICRLPVALAPLGGRDSNFMGGSHHIGLSYFLTSRLGQ